MEDIKTEFVEIKKLIEEKKKNGNTQLSKSDLIHLQGFIKVIEEESQFNK